MLGTDPFPNLPDVSEINLPHTVRCNLDDEVRAEKSVRTMISRSVEERSVEGLVLVPAGVYMTREVGLPRKVFQQLGAPVVIDEDCLVLD